MLMKSKSRKQCLQLTDLLCTSLYFLYLMLPLTCLGHVFTAWHILWKVTELLIRVEDSARWALQNDQAPGAITIVLTLVEGGAVTWVVMNTRL